MGSKIRENDSVKLEPHRKLKANSPGMCPIYADASAPIQDSVSVSSKCPNTDH